MKHTLDFEYNRKDNEFLHLVCVSLDDKVFWLDDGSQTRDFINEMKKIEGETIIAHAASLAEIPCCIKLGIDVEKYTWVCTETLYKFINHLQDGTTGNDKKTNLIDTLKDFCLLPQSITNEQKEHWRNIILSGNVENFKNDIIKYCESDTTNLVELYRRECDRLLSLIGESRRMLNGATCMDVELNTVLFETKIRPASDGYKKPIVDKQYIPFMTDKNFKNFDLDEFIKSESENHIAVAKMYMESYDADPYIVSHLQDWRFKDILKRQCNELIPGLFDDKGTRKDDVLQSWIFTNIDGAKEWWEQGFHKNGEIKSKTPTGGYSFAGDVIDYFCEEFKGNDKLEKYRVLRKLLQAVQGLARDPSDKRGWYYPNLYNDGMHCHANEHGANTTRFGNKSTSGHIPSWSKSLRSCLKPKNDNELYFSLDFNAQEMWIIGQLAHDYNLLDTYEAQDVYMKMAQQMNLYPKNLPIPTEEQRKEDWFKKYKPLRQKIKGVNLGMNYGMAAKTYAKRNNISEEEAKNYWDMFARAFDKKTDWGKILQLYFEGDKIIETETKGQSWGNGLYLMIGKEQIITRFRPTSKWGDYNKQMRAVLNFPVQCMGAQITRRAIRYAQKEGLHPFLPVHDEIYFKTTKDRFENDARMARDCMMRAAMDCFNNPLKEYPIKIGEAELYEPGANKYTIHEGAEERFEQIMNICKELDEIGPCPPQPIKEKKVKKVKKLEKMEKVKNKNENETAMEDFFV